eukprot:TRINITY_DN3746_c0_g2_i2.p1 TRINITY_DN3746_c0_g2~~TRINITY_DN3746_c0_g2_i2.p1  ORF type:complete len:1292 (+),score=525.82 TRINITY_DN3746_c0_g2_i2:491-3877(+)
MIEEKPVLSTPAAAPIEAKTKNWILSYMQESSSDEEDEEKESKPIVPKTLDELLQELEIKKKESNQAASKSDRSTIGMQIKEIKDQIEKITGSRDLPATTRSIPETKEESPNADDDDTSFGGFFESAENAEPSTSTSQSTSHVAIPDYSIARWSGKTPKQILVDVLQKMHPRSPPPKFHREKQGGLYSCTINTSYKSEKDPLSQPSPYLRSWEEAQNFASVAYLYGMNRASNHYLLLPPVFKKLWMDWLEEDTFKLKNATDADAERMNAFLKDILNKIESLDKSQVEFNLNDPKFIKSQPQRNFQKPEIGNSIENFEERKKRPLYVQMQKERTQLPMWNFRETILKTCRDYPVFIIKGETGCGKSTQTPQFILEDMLTRVNESVGSLGTVGTILCTQPRRISAMSLSDRVSQELGDSDLDSKDPLCGYQIRMESRKGPSTRLIYCTTGVLLRKLQVESQLESVTCLIMDEVHERNVQSDFLLILVRNLLKTRRDLKVILMSATMDTEVLSEYFHGCPVLSVPGRTFQVESFFLEDVVKITDYSLEEDSEYAIRKQRNFQKFSVNVSGKRGNSQKIQQEWDADENSEEQLYDLPPDEFSEKTRRNLARMDMDRINYDLILELLSYIASANFRETHFQLEDGAILIFLPGMPEIEILVEILGTHPEFSNSKKYDIIPLHSLVSTELQRKVFVTPPKGVQKIVMATNIAETGITIPDVNIVIDTFKMKQNRYDPMGNINIFEEIFISQASALQRRGRAGRVREGVCFHLVTKRHFENSPRHSTPEMLRISLDEICLQILVSRLGTPIEFLSQALDPPSLQSVTMAMEKLISVGAVSSQNEITPLGYHLSALPVDVQVGKLILFGAIFHCLEPTLILAGSASNKTPFVAPVGKRDEANQARRSFAKSHSDQIAIIRAYQKWKSQKSPAEERNFCHKFFLSRSSLRSISNAMREFRNLLKNSGFLAGNPENFDENSENENLLKALIAGAFYPNVMKFNLNSTSTSTSTFSNPNFQVAKIHPSSVNDGQVPSGYRYVVFQNLVKSSQVFLRETTFVSPLSLLLFGGKIDVQHENGTITVEDWIVFKSPAKTAVIFKALRNEMKRILSRKIEDPKLDVSLDPIIKIIVQVFRNET